MKLTLKLTLDGLLRALKARAHRLAEEVETGRLPQEERRPQRARERTDDDRRDD